MLLRAVQGHQTDIDEDRQMPMTLCSETPLAFDDVGPRVHRELRQPSLDERRHHEITHFPSEE